MNTELLHLFIHHTMGHATSNPVSRTQEFLQGDIREAL